MTVGELIELLSLFDSNATVVADGELGDTVSNVELIGDAVFIT
jgi:hypothetical protein